MMESKREMEAENEVARMKKEEEELITKRRKIHDSEIGADDSLDNSEMSTLVMNGELSCDYLKSTDLKGGEDSETVASTFMSGEFSIEASPSAEILGGEEPGEEATMGSSPSSSTRKRKSSPRKCCVAKTPPPPSTAEIDEFFSAAEKSEQERFAKKYNYDIVKDVPMEGRYQWIPLIKEL